MVINLAYLQESSQSPLTSPVVDLPRASDPRQPPPRILEEDEEIEQEKIKQTLDLQFQKQQQQFQSMEEWTSTAGASTLSGQAVPKANVSPVWYAHEQPPPAGFFHEHPLAGGFAAQQNVRSGADIGPAAVQVTDPQPPYSLSALHPRVDPIDPRIQQQVEVHELYERGSNLDQNLDSLIHAQAETVVTEVGDESSRQLTMHHIPYDPNLTCPMCNKRFRIGEIQKYRKHVNKQCAGTQEVITNV